MSMNLNTGNWKEFRLGNLFAEMYKAEAHIKADLECFNMFSHNTIKFVSRTEMNNGCDCYVLNNDLTGIEDGNAISIGDTTATCFYQSERFICGDHMVICRAGWLNKYTALFVLSILKQEKYKYSYGRAFKMDLISSTVIKLPATADGSPDWDFMEQYIKSLNYKPLTTQNSHPQHPLKIDSWQEFRLNDILDIKRGESLYLNASEIGTTPYASASAEDNGISAYIDIKPNREGNCLSINYDGSVGEAYYQAKPFFASEKIVTATLKKHQINQYIALFLSTIIKMEKYRFSYGRKWTVESSMKKSVIKLPIVFNADGTPYVEKELGYSLEGYVPDWDYMENYIKSLPYGDRI